MPEYQGVDVEHPRIKEYAQNLIKQGRKREDIARIVGMPHEVIARIEREMKEREKR